MSNPDEIELPRPHKRRRTEDENLVREVKGQILIAVQNATKPPAKIVWLAPLVPEVVKALTDWARGFEYVLHYKEKKKRFDDIPGDVRHEGRYAMVSTGSLEHQ